MNIREAARAYLHDAPTEWLSFAKSLTARVSEDISQRMVQQDPGLDAGTLADTLSECLLSVLLAPQNLLLIAGAKNDARAVGEIVQSLLTSIDDPATTAGVEESDYWEEIVELASSGQPVYRAWAWDDYWDAEPLLTVRHMVRGHLNASRLRKLVSSFCGGSPGTPGSESQGLVRLDVIDLALYTALVQHPELLKTLDWRVFERLLADALETFGYEIELQRGTKDGGVDIFAIRNDQLGPHRYILQAKRWSHRVSVEPVRQLLFLHSYHRATKSCLATTSGFTRGAWDLANQYRWQLDLRDWEGIQDWVREAARLKRGET